MGSLLISPLRGEKGLRTSDLRPSENDAIAKGAKWKKQALTIKLKTFQIIVAQ